MARPKATEPKKPRKPRGPNKAKTEPEAQAKPSPASAAVNHQFKKPEPEQVRRLVKSLVSMGNDARSITQAVGEKIAKAVENQHFDKKALAMAKTLYQQAKNHPEQFAITLPHLLAYIDDLDLTKVADDARGLPINGESDEDDGDDEHAEATTQPDEQPTTGKSPGLRMVPKGGDEVPAAPKSETEAA